MLQENVVTLLKKGMWDLATCANGEPNVVPVAFKDVTPGGKPPVDDLRVTGEANRHGGIVMGFQQCHNSGNGSVLKIIFQNKRFSHFHQLGRGVVQNVHGRCAQLNLFCPAVKAQIVKQHLLDGVPALEFPETPKS